MTIFYVIGNPVKATQRKFFNLWGQPEPRTITEEDIFNSLIPKTPGEQFFLIKDKQIATEYARESAYAASGSGAIDPSIILPVLEVQIRDQTKLQSSWDTYFKNNEPQQINIFLTSADNIGEVKSYFYQFRDQKIEKKLHQPRYSFSQ
jgi:hypothetical protein